LAAQANFKIFGVNYFYNSPMKAPHNSIQPTPSLSSQQNFARVSTASSFKNHKRTTGFEFNSSLLFVWGFFNFE